MVEMCDLLLQHASDPEQLSGNPVVQAAAQRWIEVLGEAASLRRWRPDVSTADRAVALAEFAMSAEVPEQRITAMEMLGRLDPINEVEPAVRQMLHSPCAVHATMFLLERGLASPDELGAFSTSRRSSIYSRPSSMRPTC